MAEGVCKVGFADADSDGDRLQHFRAVLPCEVRVISPVHPLFGRLLPAGGFKRIDGAVFLVVELPDGGWPCTMLHIRFHVVGGL